ncbi:hypothetical protein [Nocardia sputi]|uniref:hypothetical protein n=1 Tax=Nocardia sputi TaxID=2943705 RepID=UPI0020BEAF00|nr:hypothetical protein [Nocardia sputi]
MDPALVLSRAFDAEPGMAWIAGDRGRHWFAATARLPHLVTRTAPGAAALLSPPGATPDAAARSAWTMHVLFHCGPAAIHRTLRYTREAERRKPSDAWTLEFIGAEHPGHGAGRRLLALIVDEFEDLWLTTADPDNVPLYRRFGFSVTDHWTLGALEIHALHRVR